MIKSRSVYQSYLGSHMIENTKGQEGWVALEQLDLFLPILRGLFAKHQGLKSHLSATSKFYMSVGGDDEYNCIRSPTVARCVHIRTPPFILSVCP